ncbi:MAG: YidB family protein [Thiolinea sp.]
MDISSIMQTGAQLFQGKLDADGDGQIEISDLVPALTGLFSNEAGDFDVSSIMSNMNAGGLMEMAQSWLGDGENQAISGDQITQMLGSEKVSAFASQLGLSEDQALGGLQEAVPGIIDQVSNGGSLMDMAGSLMSEASSSGGGIMGMVGKLFGR